MGLILCKIIEMERFVYMSDIHGVSGYCDAHEIGA